MKISKNISQQAVTVSELEVQKTGHGDKLEPVFILRAGDEYFDKTIGFYKSLAYKNFPPTSQRTLDQLIQEGKNWPKHRTDGKVRYEESDPRGEKTRIVINGQDIGEGFKTKADIEPLLSSLSALVAEGGHGIMAKIKSVVSQIEEARK